MSVQDPTRTRAGTGTVPRSRGAISGLLLLLLGAWGALIPFIGPYFHFAYSPDSSWHWSAARGWFEVLPGAVAAVGGLILMTTTKRFTALFAGWLAALAGAWFVVGPTLAPWLHLGNPGQPVGTSTAKRTFEQLAFFDGIGAVILFLGALALGRLSVRSVRDLRKAMAQEEAERREAALAAQRQQAAESSPGWAGAGAGSPAGTGRAGSRTEQDSGATAQFPSASQSSTESRSAREGQSSGAVPSSRESRDGDAPRTPQWQPGAGNDEVRSTER